MSLFEALKAGKPLREHISPEGVEEKILVEDRYLITQTMGGKFRLYRITNDVQCSQGVFDTIDRAAAEMGVSLILAGGLLGVAFSRKPSTEKKP